VSSSSPITSNYSYIIDTREAKEKPTEEELAQEPLPPTRALDLGLEESDLPFMRARESFSISIALSLLKSSSIVRVP